MSDREEHANGPWSRRGILAAAGLAGMGALAAGWDARTAAATEAGTAAVAEIGVPTDGAAQFAQIPGRNINEKVLNFALTLEILEADLYRQALNIASGRPVGTALASNPGSYRRTVPGGGLSAELTQAGFLYLVQFTYIEAAHRDFLRAAIAGGGGTPVRRNPGGYRFPTAPAATIRGLLAGILPLEETGVRAYLGALPYLTDLNLAVVAGGIYSTECRHSAAILGNLNTKASAIGPSRMPGDQQSAPTQPSDNTFEYYLSPRTVITRAAAFFA